VVYVELRFFPREWFQMGEDRDPLAQLLEAGGGYLFCQMWLPGKNDLQELLLRSLEVREHPYELQDGVAKILRLIHHYHDALAQSRLLDQNVLQSRLHTDEVPVRVLDAESGKKRPQKIERGAYGPKQKNGQGALAQATLGI
jgi:hypothetical protein